MVQNKSIFAYHNDQSPGIVLGLFFLGGNLLNLDRHKIGASIQLGNYGVFLTFKYCR
jgi:hypothetical protein